MTRQPQRRSTRHSRDAAVRSTDRRGWLSHGLAALAISALGLAVAGSMSLTTNAQTQGGDPPTRVAITAGQNGSGAPGSGPGGSGPGGSGPGGSGTGTAGTVLGVGQTSSNSTAPELSPAAQAFVARPSGIDTSRSGELRAALAKERAAQRAEDLAEAAELVTRAVRDEARKVRQTKLDATEQQIQENAVKLAWARQQRAIAARVAARLAVASASSTTTTTTPTDPNPGSIPSGGSAVAPVPGAVVGAHFGQYGLWSRYHTGLDFRAGFGTQIRAVLPGVVVFAGNTGDWAGNHVAVRHADGWTTMSSHMSRMAVSAGQTVSAGQIIGYVGQTGRAFGPHLHFEAYPPGVKYGDVYRAKDPQAWLRLHGVQTH